MNERIRNLCVNLYRNCILFCKFLYRNSIRFCKYYYFKFIRQSGKPEYIARGVSLGLFIGMFIPFGLQIIVVLPLAVWFKAAKIPSIAFTFLTNHITIWILYPLQCYVGSWIIARPFEYSQIKDTLKSALTNQSLSELFSLGWSVVTSFFAGGLVFGLGLAIPGYFIAMKMIIMYRARKAKKQKNSRNKYGVVKNKDIPAETTNK